MCKTITVVVEVEGLHRCAHPSSALADRRRSRTALTLVRAAAWPSAVASALLTTLVLHQPAQGCFAVSTIVWHYVTYRYSTMCMPMGGGKPGQPAAGGSRAAIGNRYRRWSLRRRRHARRHHARRRRKLAPWRRWSFQLARGAATRGWCGAPLGETRVDRLRLFRDRDPV